MSFLKINQTIKSASLFIILTLAASLSIAGTVEDTDITASVRAALVLEPDIPVQRIEVTTTDKVVSLRGTVDTKLQADKVVEVASSINNVVDVINTDLKVKDSSSFITDSLITAKAKGKIRYLSIGNKIAEGHDLHVETTDQIVHIFGEVAKEEDIRTITETVKTINQVKSVRTNIRVRA